MNFFLDLLSTMLRFLSFCLDRMNKWVFELAVLGYATVIYQRVDACVRIRICRALAAGNPTGGKDCYLDDHPSSQRIL